MQQALNCSTLTELKFVGGPFDGFSQHASVTLDELPDAVALPLNAEANRLFGCELEPSNREVVYRLHREGQTAQYHFCRTRVG